MVIPVVSDSKAQKVCGCRSGSPSCIQNRRSTHPMFERDDGPFGDRGHPQAVKVLTTVSSLPGAGNNGLLKMHCPSTPDHVGVPAFTIKSPTHTRPPHGPSEVSQFSPSREGHTVRH